MSVNLFKINSLSNGNSQLTRFPLWHLLNCLLFVTKPQIISKGSEKGSSLPGGLTHPYHTTKSENPQGKKTPHSQSPSDLTWGFFSFLALHKSVKPRIVSPWFEQKETVRKKWFFLPLWPLDRRLSYAPSPAPGMNEPLSPSSAFQPCCSHWQ